MNRHFSLPRLSPVRVVALTVVLALLGALLGFAAASAGSTTYTSSRQVLIRVWSIDSLVLSGQTADTSASDLADAATVITSADVLGAAAATLDEPGVTEATLADSVTASAAQTSDFVAIDVTAPTGAEADQRAQVVAESFVAIVRKKVLASAQQIAALTAGGDNTTQSDIQVRAQAVAALDPVQIYRTGLPERTGISTPTATAAGAVGGVAIAALLVVLLAFAGPRLRRPGDVANSLGLPALAWDPEHAPWSDDEDEAGAQTVGGLHGLAADLVRAAGKGSVVVCPARPEDAHAADQFAQWLAATTPSANGARSPLAGVVRIDSPATGLAASRPPADAIDTAVLVTAAGTSTETIARAATLLEGWRAVDAVILVE